MPGRLKILASLGLTLAFAFATADISLAETKKRRGGKTAAATASKSVKEGAETKPAPAAEPPAPPYEAQILRLAEILGALSHLDEICGGNTDGAWRGKMQALIDAEARTAFQKERLAGTFNRSFRGYQMSYHACTGNARAAIGRFLNEGSRLAHEIVDRYGAS
jgi:uncharacterized protein (TIGR02301 family)